MEQYYVTVRKIVPLSAEEKTEIEKRRENRNGSYRSSEVDQPFMQYQQGLIPFNPNESKLQVVLDVVVDSAEYGAIKSKVIEIKN